ncbi:hypothetical protein CHS0354_043111 [Potamilus streckersoni]|uniref:G-protein coupled receptors family 1 profile domain-containing protein n=1 Tax=Potamilus streckersoni TaxID=2493646 RepID=A0AAE0VSW8_9BIVA|nr:hypothetical protein CHS0354_043111 [Potamilus streckersoni]
MNRDQLLRSSLISLLKHQSKCITYHIAWDTYFDTVKMMMAVILAYAVCWLPLHILTLVGDLNPDIFNQVYMHTIWLFSHLLAVFNSTINPLVYFWMDSTYRCGLGYCARKLLGTRTINSQWKVTFPATNSSQKQSRGSPC